MSDNTQMIENAWRRELQGAQSENREVRVSLKNGEVYMGRITLLTEHLVTLDTQWPTGGKCPENTLVAIGEMATMKVYRRAQA